MVRVFSNANAESDTDSRRIRSWAAGWDLRRRKGSLRDSDRKLVEAIRSGDSSAFEELYRTYLRPIHNFSLRKLGDPTETEDVTQDVFLAVFTGLDRFEGKSELAVWIYGITRNILNNRLRRRGGVQLISLEKVPPQAAPVNLGPEPRVAARQTLGCVRHAIEALPRDQRRILELRLEKRLAIRRIAEIMNRSENAVKCSLHRARRTLRSFRTPGRKSLSNTHSHERGG